jgi:hypothetical protein
VCRPRKIANHFAGSYNRECLPKTRPTLPASNGRIFPQKNAIKRILQQTLQHLAILSQEWQVKKRHKPLINKGLCQRGRRDSNPQPPDRQSSECELQPVYPQGLTSTPVPVCTRVCTRNEKTENAAPAQVSSNDNAEKVSPANPLFALAAALAALSESDRIQLVSILSQLTEGKSDY